MAEKLKKLAKTAFWFAVVVPAGSGMVLWVLALLSLLFGRSVEQVVAAYILAVQIALVVAATLAVCAVLGLLAYGVYAGVNKGVSYVTFKAVEQRVETATQQAEAEMNRIGRVTATKFAQKANQALADLELYDRKLQQEDIKERQARR